MLPALQLLVYPLGWKDNALSYFQSKHGLKVFFLYFIGEKGGEMEQEEDTVQTYYLLIRRHGLKNIKAHDVPPMR